jgi:transcription antitermination factor NusG
VLQAHEINPTVFEPAFLADDEQWFAVMTKPRHEKAVARELRLKDIEVYLPVISEVRRWSDRNKVVELPLFSCYVFVKIMPTAADKVAVLRTQGVLQFVGSTACGTAIPESEINNIRTILLAASAKEVTITRWGLIRVGSRVRVRGGALDGVEGLLAECGRRLVVSVDAIQRSLSITLNGCSIEPVSAQIYRKETLCCIDS